MEPGYEIYEYSRRGMVEDLREALSQGSPADEYMAYDGSTALVMAARSGHGHAVQALIDHAASLEVRTDDGSTVLHHAVSGGSADAVKAFINAGVDVNQDNEDGVTPLMLAAHYGFGHIVGMLCDAGADVNRSADGWGTALDSAQGAATEVLEKRGARCSANGVDQPLAKGAERFHYGCFDMGENPNSTPIQAPAAPKKPTLGYNVRLRRSKPGLLKEGDIGVVVEDDGSDCVPLKVQLNDAYDYYDYADVEICEPPVELPPDSDRASPEGTARFAASKLKVAPSILASSGLSISPVGFGCHRIDASPHHKAALELAIQLGCNLVDVAPNYTDGAAELAVGEVLAECISNKKVRRDEIVVATKVGNVLGKQLAHVEGIPNMSEISPELKHCISPEWIEQEITRSLERLQLSCIDVLLLHCPEFEAKAPDVDMPEVYRRLGAAFRHLETEVEKGRIQMYGVSAAFTPLRPTDPEHLDLHEVVGLLPEGHHFRVLQFPLNYAEAQTLWVAHTPRTPDGVAIDKEKAQEMPTLFEAAKEYGLAIWTNRPLDGIYKESHGVLRFSSLDCDMRSFSELQLDNCDALEEKLTSMSGLDDAPYGAGAGASGQLAPKTVKVLSSLEGVDCVLLGMRKPEYALTTLPLVFATPPLPGPTATSVVRGLHNTVAMWFATAINEADHGTSKDWRLPVEQKGMLVSPVKQESVGA